MGDTGEEVSAGGNAERETAVCRDTEKELALTAKTPRKRWEWG